MGLRRITQIHIFYPMHSFKEFELNWEQVKKNLAATPTRLFYCSALSSAY